MSRSIDAVWARAAKHLQAVAKVVSQMEDLTRSRKVPESEHDMRAAASYLDDFYSAAESVFGIIASAVDGSMPKGEAWHPALLDQIAHEVRGVRPAVISPDLYHNLGDLPVVQACWAPCLRIRAPLGEDAEARREPAIGRRSTG